MTDTKQVLQEKFPFLTVIKHLDREYLGIVQHADNAFIHLYVMDNTFNDLMKREFLECGEIWWWESNRSIPINIFLKSEWDPFKVYLRTFVNKDLAILHGPICSLSEMARKKSKRKSITLVRRME